MSLNNLNETTVAPGIPNYFGAQRRSDQLPDSVYERVRNVMASAQLFRYGDTSGGPSEAALLEKEMAEYLGVKYALAVNSASSAIFLALAASGVVPGDKVLTSAFTFTAVPGAIMHAYAQPVLVESDRAFHLDLDDLRQRITPETKALVLSHMRGHVSDLDTISEICQENEIFLIEDAAHSLGVGWGDQLTGTVGDAGCFSFQSNKIINAGEGGLLVSNHEEFMVKAVILSGAFEDHWKEHFIESSYFEKYARRLPKYNFRMNNLSAAIVRSQIDLIAVKRERYLYNHRMLVKGLSENSYLEIPERLPKEQPAPNTLQIRLKGMSEAQKIAFSNQLKAMGLKHAIFGLDPGNDRAFWNWEYLEISPDCYPQTVDLLMNTCDVKTPYEWEKDDIDRVIKCILVAVREQVELQPE